QPDAATFPPERYPAAFDNIIGVAALDSNYQPTPYTSADTTSANTAGTAATAPANLGVATFGGDVVRLPSVFGGGTNPTGGDAGGEEYWQADDERGILGVYIGTKFPDGRPNESGWARWAGTSFATPIVTGLLALLLSAQTTQNLNIPQDFTAAQ